MINYKELSKVDIIGKLKPWFDNGAFFLREDGKLTRKTRLSHNTPWIHQKIARNRNCGLYHIYFEAFKFIHSVCQDCWKVVVRPRTLMELHRLLEMQKVMGLPSKCGIERRDSVFGLYGGYFYNDSLAQGLDCMDLVRVNVDSNISSDVPIFLKKGCTEFELEIGPSDEWEVSDEQKEMEYLLMDIVDNDISKSVQPDHLKDSVFRTWIHWAYQNGDLTYKEYTDGEPLFRPYVTYEREEASRPDSTGL